MFLLCRVIVLLQFGLPAKSVYQCFFSDFSQGRHEEGQKEKQKVASLLTPTDLLVIQEAVRIAARYRYYGKALRRHWTNI